MPDAGSATPSARRVRPMTDDPARSRQGSRQTTQGPLRAMPAAGASRPRRARRHFGAVKVPPPLIEAGALIMSGCPAAQDNRSPETNRRFSSAARRRNSARAKRIDQLVGDHADQLADTEENHPGQRGGNEVGQARNDQHGAAADAPRAGRMTRPPASAEVTTA